MRSAQALLAGLAGMLVLSGASFAASADVRIAPVTRLPFPERGYVVSIPQAADLGAADVEVRENGLRVTDLRVDPLGSSGLRFLVAMARALAVPAWM